MVVVVVREVSEDIVERGVGRKEEAISNRSRFKYVWTFAELSPSVRVTGLISTAKVRH